MSIVIKFLMVTVVLELVLPRITPLGYQDILLISAAVTLLAYVIGDLFILDKTNNTIATICDFGLATATIYMFNYFPRLAGTIDLFDALIGSAVLAIGEVLFHIYMVKSVFHNRLKEA